MVIKMAKYSIDKNLEVVDMVSGPQIWGKYKCPINFNFDAKIVGENDTVLNVVELSYIKNEFVDSTELGKSLIQEMSYLGFNFICLEKEVWVGDTIKYKLNFMPW